jgi:ATP synthase protein I
LTGSGPPIIFARAYGANPAKRGVFRAFFMSEEKTPQSLEQLDVRLKQAEAERQPSAPEERAIAEGSMSGFGMAFRIGTELVAALAVGVGIGLLLDNWLDTTPWLMVVFFFVGAAAGILNVYRATSGIGLAPGYRKPGDGGPGNEEQDGPA